MSTASAQVADARYRMGRTDAETQRLIRQWRRYDNDTRR
jgi:hypothetical protein